jgi:hypothetical protein
MSKAKDPDKNIVLAMFDYNFITGQLTRKNQEPFWSSLHHGYRWLRCANRIVAYHRVAWLICTGSWPEEDVDHENRNKDCNTWINLRAATRKQNTENRIAHKNNKLGIRGIKYRDKDGFYEPRLMHKGKAIYLGIFKDLDAAIAARKKAEQEMFTHAR